MTPDADRPLVDAIIASGDERAFAALYDRHTPALYRLALRLTGGVESEAAEIAHDAWVEAVERLARFEWRAPLRTWLCAFVVHRWRQLGRAAKRDAGTVQDLGLGADDAELTGVYGRLDLERAIAGLADGYRQVFVLHDVEGYTHDEIADLLGLSPGTSKSQLSRARLALRRALEPRGDST